MIGRIDPRIYYFGADFRFIAAPDEEFWISYTWSNGRSGPEGWEGGYIWRLESECGVLFDALEWIGLAIQPYGRGDKFQAVNDWLLPLTGYTRSEFLEAFP